MASSHSGRSRVDLITFTLGVGVLPGHTHTVLFIIEFVRSHEVFNCLLRPLGKFAKQWWLLLFPPTLGPLVYFDWKPSRCGKTRGTPSTPHRSVTSRVAFPLEYNQAI